MGDGLTYEERQELALKELYGRNLIPSTKENTMKSMALMFIGMMLPMFTFIFLLPAFKSTEGLMFVIVLIVLEIVGIAYVEKVRLSSYVEGVTILDGSFFFGENEVPMRHRIASHHTIIEPETELEKLEDFSEKDLMETIKKFKELKEIVVGDEINLFKPTMFSGENAEAETKAFADELQKHLPKGVSVITKKQKIGSTLEFVTIFKFGRFYVEQVNTMEGDTFYVVSIDKFSEMLKPEIQYIDVKEWFTKANVAYGIFKFIEQDRDPVTGMPVGIYYLAFSNYFIRKARVVSPDMFKMIKPEEVVMVKDAVGLYPGLVYKQKYDELLDYTMSLEAILRDRQETRLETAEQLAENIFDTFLYGKRGISKSSEMLLDEYMKDRGLKKEEGGWLSKNWKWLAIGLGVTVAAIFGIFFFIL